MKKVIAILLLVCVVFSGCSMLMKADVTEKAFSIATYDLQLTADSTFYENTGGSFDLQITNDKAYVSIMAYRYIDLPEGITPRDVYDTQNEDLFSRRTAVTVIEETEELSQNITGGAIFSGEGRRKKLLRNIFGGLAPGRDPCLGAGYVNTVLFRGQPGIPV